MERYSDENQSMEKGSSDESEELNLKSILQ